MRSLRKVGTTLGSLKGECAYEQEGEEASDDAEDEESDEKENEEEEEAADLAALVEVSGYDVRSSEHGDVEDVRDVEVPSIASATEADALTQSQTLISVLEAAMETLKEVGLQSAVAHMAHENPKGAAKGACYRQRRPRRIVRVSSAKGSRRGPGTKAEAPFGQKTRRGH